MTIIFLLTLPLLALANPAAVTPCTVGNDTPCLPSSTCTPTMISTSNQPWLGQCIATPTTPIITATPPILTITNLPRPTSTECHVGWENQCNTGSTCTPTMTCQRLLPCGGKCIATPTPLPPPSSATCNVGWENQCGPQSTCTPIETCYRLRPCRGSCIATATPPVISATPPILTITAVPTPTSRAGCMVGWESQCGAGSACTPVETCYRLRPCHGACIATAVPSGPKGCSVGWENQCGGGSTCTPTQTCVRGRPCGGACIATAMPL